MTDEAAIRRYLAQCRPRFFLPVRVLSRLFHRLTSRLRGHRRCFSYHEGENYLDNLIVQPISRNRSILCASPAYLARRGRPASPADLAQHNCLRYLHPEGDPRWHLKNGKHLESVLPLGNLQSDHSELLLEATCAGLGIAEFEIWLIRDLLVSGALEVVLPDYQLENALTGKQIYMAYLPNRRFSTKVRVLRRFLAERLKGIGER